MIILCEVKKCIYHITLKNEGKAYQEQCGTDEIEIGINPNTKKPQCFTFERELSKLKRTLKR